MRATIRVCPVAVLLSVAFSGVLGCQSGGSKPGGASGGAAGTAGTAGSLGGALTGGATGGGGTGGSTRMCSVDSPCQFSYKCYGSDSYQAYTTNWDCHSVCGPGPCEGASCVSSGSPVACPAGTKCVGGGFNDVSMGCRPVSDAGADARLKDPADATTVEPPDARGSDLGLKPPTDTSASDVSVKPPLLDGGAACTPGERRCRGNDPAVEACSANGQWRDESACPYVCSAGACIGECLPGLRRRCRATGEVPQDCDSAGAWIDEAACSGSTPYCATGQCVAACLGEGQDCTDPKTACCAGTECVSVTERTFACKAIPACAALGSTCTANTDCCAGLDCTAGKCAAKATSCFDRREDGICGGASGGTCCPGTTCGRDIYSNTMVCAIPSTTNPQEVGCPRDQPALHDACRASKLGLNCAYSDWSKLSGIFFYCTCSYHGWSCTKNYYAH